jgi:hypothetical protein
MSIKNLLLSFFNLCGLNNNEKNIHIEILNAKLIEETFITPHCPYIKKSIPKHFTFIEV